MNKLVGRHEKVAFMGVNSNKATKFYRMQGFTDLTTSKNPKEYSRQYVDEEFERTGIIGFSPSIAYSFDRYTDTEVHRDLIYISDQELLRAEAEREIVVVDFNEEGTANGTYAASKRLYSVIPDGEGSGTDAYIYTGTFKTADDQVSGYATSSDDWITCTFTEAE